ncbi:hypothetical protein GCM10022278_24030 [Allohahella marinimesophila]|uniref:Uncharacterized protein n=1 Tax=Allohahella marinimesophila TaxID=1054972 RepID=A0ABP7PI36_9GAMM
MIRVSPRAIVDEPVFTETLYHYVNRQHQQQVEALAQLLKQAKAEGCAERISSHVLSANAYSTSQQPAVLCSALRNTAH